MPTPSSVIPIRAGTKATPEAVFAVCDQLKQEKAAAGVENPTFTIEEVRAITGGGLGTVTRLVGMYRLNEKIIQENETLTGEATITLVQALDKLLKLQVDSAKKAVNDFIEGAGHEISELSEALEAQQETLETARAESAALREQRQARETELTQTQTHLADRTRALAEARTQHERLTAELKQTQATHAAKLEALDSQHQTKLSQALETQRKSMEEEKNTALEKAEAAGNLRLAASRDETQRTEQALKQAQQQRSAAEAREHALTLRTQTLAAEIAALNRLHQAQIDQQDALLAEKQHALRHAETAQQQLIASIERQHSVNTQDLESRLHTLASATEPVTTALGDIQTLFDEMRQVADQQRIDDEP